ncbi:MAG: tetratricopeptide repeat protein, partial [Planctomycetaceae bacterium]
HQQAIRLLEETLDLFREYFGPEHPNNLSPMNNLAISYGVIGKHDEAVQLHEESLELHRAQLGPYHPRTLTAMHNLASTYRDPHRSQEAIALHEETVRLCRTHLGDQHPNTLNSIRSLIIGYQTIGRHSEASRLIEELVALERQVRPDSSDHARALAIALVYLLADQRYAEAEEYARECLAIRQQEMPDDWRTYHTQVILGRSLAGQERFAEAERLLVDGYRGMVARRASIPQQAERRLNETLDAIIQFYEHRNRTEEVVRWRLVRDAQSADPSQLIPADETDPEHIAQWYLAWLDALPPDPEHGWNYPRSKLARRIAESDDVFAQVIEARPDDDQLWIERGRMFALRSRWSEAVEAYRRADRPGIPIETFELACALLLSGDQEGYRELCVRLSADADPFADPVSAFHLAWITGIGPSGIEPERIIHWAVPMVELEGRAWHLHALALAHYRANDYARTIHYCQQASAHAWQADFLNHWLLAMTHARLGNPEEVGRSCAEAEHMVLRWMPREPGGPAACLPPDWLSFQVLRRETESLLGIGDEAESPQSTDPERVAAQYLAWLDELPAEPEAGWRHPRRNLAKQIAESDDVFARVIEARPDDCQLWIERGRTLVLRSRWSEAVEAYRRAERRGIRIETFELAGALLLSGDQDGYRQLCASLLDDPDQPADSTAAFHLARIVSFGPSGIEPERALAWASTIVREEGQPWHLHVLALAHYRAGNYVDTIRFCQQSNAQGWHAGLLNHWLLAMAHHQLGNSLAADNAQAQAESLAENWMSKESGEPVSNLPPPDWVSLHLLCRQFQELQSGAAAGSVGSGSESIETREPPDDR